jgi:chromate reductase
MTIKISIIVASGFKNLELAQKMELELKSFGATVSLLNLTQFDLPLYTAESDAKNDAKKLLGDWFENLHAADGLVFLAPEYNGGIPPLLTNFLAWVSRSSKDWRNCFNGKAAAIGTHSGGGGHHVLMAMRMQLSYIGMTVLGRQILTHSGKALDEQTLKSVCQELIRISQK